MSPPPIGSNSAGAEWANLNWKLREERKVNDSTGRLRHQWEVMLSGMNLTDKAIALFISVFAEEDGISEPTMAWLEHLTGVKKRRILEAVAAIKKADLLLQKSTAHRARHVVYEFKIPDRTLLEISERMHACAPKPERVHVETPKKLERVRQCAPNEPNGCTDATRMGAHQDTHSSPNKDLKNNITTSTTDAENVDDLVHVNGVSITGPGFEMRYSEIDYAAVLAGATKDRARAKAALMAYDWARRGFVPGNAITMFTSALRTDQLHVDTYGHKLKKTVAEIESATQKPPPTPRKENFYDERARETEDAWSKYDYSGKR